jgi:hypothetical protein
VTGPGGLSAPTSAAPASGQTAAKAGTATSHLPAVVSFKDTLTHATQQLQPVHGHAYSKITGGDDAGRYVNTSHNARDGQTFAIEHHGGRRWHVYGEGADRVVIAFPKAGAPPATGAPALEDDGSSDDDGTAAV